MASLVNLCAQCDIKNKKFILGSGCANSSLTVGDQKMGLYAQTWRR